MFTWQFSTSYTNDLFYTLNELLWQQWLNISYPDKGFIHCQIPKAGHSLTAVLQCFWWQHLLQSNYTVANYSAMFWLVLGMILYSMLFGRQMVVLIISRERERGTLSSHPVLYCYGASGQQCYR